MLSRRRPPFSIALALSCAWLPLLPVLAQRDLKDIPIPDPASELAAMKIAEGFEVNLFASDPDFSKPIHMNFDPEGRLWIACSKNYPQIEPGAKPTDQIVVLEDTDGDGRADKRTVFADDLLIPTGVLPGDGGVYVANSTELIHLADTDGDGKADRRKTILSGFGTEDTHHLLHTLRWGPDGRLYMNQSIYIHSHIETPTGIKRLDGGGIWRFDPQTYELEILCKGFVNPWGHVINRYGQSLATDGAYSEGINYVFPDSVFFSSPGAERWLSGLNPGSPKHCSLEQVTGAAMPEDAQNWFITNDFRAHRVCVFQVERQGSSYRSVQLPELIRTNHVAFRPIDVKMGGDGAIYIADWYNPIIQHGEVDFRDARRDTEHGRIWRVTAKGKKPLKPPAYSQLSCAELCERLGDSAEWVRQFARMELARRSQSERQKALANYVAQAKDPQVASQRRLEEFWVSLCAREINVALIDALRKDADPRLRAAALRFVGRFAKQLPQANNWLREAATDSDDQVVLETVCALEELGNLAAVETLVTVATRSNQDQSLRFALWNAFRKTEPVWSSLLSSGKWEPAKNVTVLRLLADAASQAAITKPLLEQLKSTNGIHENSAQIVELIAERAAVDSMSSLVEWITTEPSIPDLSARQRYLETVARVSLSRKAGADRAGELIVKGLAASEKWNSSAGVDDYRAALVELAGQWQVVDAVPWIEQWLRNPEVGNNGVLLKRVLPALAQIGNPSAQALVQHRATSTEASFSVRAPSLVALGIFDANKAAQLAIQALATLNATDTAAGQYLVTSLLARKTGLEAMRKAIVEASKLTWTPAGARTLVASMRNAQGVDQALIDTAVQVTKMDSFAWKWTDDFAKRMLDLAAGKGDAARGEAIYRQSRLQCVRCHAIGPSGGAIGPNLVSLGGSSTPEYILQSLIEPSAKMKEGFQTLSVLVDDGRVLLGLQKARSERQLQLVLADGTEQTISMESVESIKNGQSLMPAGLVDTLTEQELADLTRFLMSLSREPAYTVDTLQRVRSWQALQWSPEALRLLNRTSLDSAASTAKELVWAPLTSTVSGSLPLAEVPIFQPHRDLPEYAIVAFELDCKATGNVRLHLTPKPEAVSLWFDGRPLPTPNAATGIKLTTGSHRFVLGIKVKESGADLGCEVKTDQPGDAVVEVKALR